MHATVGDRLVIKGHSVGDPDRDAEILEVRGPDGTPPFVVRWDDSGHETLFFPGPDAVVEHLGHDEGEHALAGEVIRSEHHRLFAALRHVLDAADGLDDDVDVLPDAVHEVYAFLVNELLPHARTEEHTFYPVVGELLGAPAATAPMSRQHVEVERLVERLGRLRDGALVEVDGPSRRNLRQVLYGLHAILSLHLATEEELYVPLVEAKLSPKRSEHLAEELAHADAPRSTAVAPR